MTRARVIRLPVTPAGRYWLREAAIGCGGWGKPGGATLEDFDWDENTPEPEAITPSLPDNPRRRGGR